MTGKDEPVTPASDPADSPTPISTPPRGRIGRRWWAIGVAIAALVVIVLVPLASPDPDGLQRVAEDQGFLERAQNLFSGLLGGYAIPGIDNAGLSKVLAGLVGVLIVVGIVLILGRIVARRRVQD